MFLSTLIGFPVSSTNVVTGRTVGVYVFVTTVPFTSFTCTDTPVVFPTNSDSGVNVMTLFINVYVPSPGTFTSVAGDPSFPTNVVVVGSNATDS